MNITATIPLSPAEEIEIATILGCQPAHLNAKLNEYMTASANEYLSMIRGQKVFKRGSDILEYRLFLLIESAFNGEIPDERTVSSLFQTTLTESRSLIRAVISKYQYKLRTHIDATIRTCLGAADRQNPGDHYSVVINSQNIVDELNKFLADIDGNLASVAKRKGSVSTYEFAPSSYNQLCGRLGVTPNP
ncbi:MAG: hypothetical protein DI587_06945 [Variovorax paradoxus]|nr:MAG: hypothetical protein DI583_06945 [Variovorax paradoxus]PZQ13271.1 MAG: hypothetical protein DI587_06945 [Variovorax paradoxus]